MDCTDLVIGSAKGGYSRVGDYYTRDRSTPVHDEYLGGENSLTAGLVVEQGDYTILLFRKKLTADKYEKTDHSLANEVTHVLWAMGQSKNPSTGQYNHWPESALETEGVSLPDFYREDELKYHGHEGQRGAAAFNFYPAESPEEDCTRGTCSAKTCGLEFSWQYDVDTDVITFNISAKYVTENQWIALGFSDDEAMVNSDVIYGGIDTDGTPFVRDGWLYAQKPPRVDGKQDAQLVSGQHVGKRTTLVFTRKRTTGDSEDLDLAQCRYVFFANKGGTISSTTGIINKHVSKPVISAQKICFGVCQKDATYATLVTIRFPDTEYLPAYSDPQSAEYKETAADLVIQLRKPLEQQLGNKLQKIVILALRSGSLIVDFEVQTKAKPDVKQEAVQQEVTSAVESLKEQTIEGYGALEVTSIAEPYRVDDNGVDRREPEGSGLTEAEIIIIAVVLALVLVAALIGLCKFLEMRRARQHDKQRVMGGGDGADSGSQSKGKMTYGEFMATSASHNGTDHSNSLKTGSSSGYPAFGNPGYESAGYKLAP